jgi:hypothetical protein
MAMSWGARSRSMVLNETANGRQRTRADGSDTLADAAAPGVDRRGGAASPEDAGDAPLGDVVRAGDGTGSGSRSRLRVRDGMGRMDWVGHDDGTTPAEHGHGHHGQPWRRAHGPLQRVGRERSR